MNPAASPPVLPQTLASIKFSISLFDLIKCRLWVIHHNAFLLGINIFFSLLIPFQNLGRLKADLDSAQAVMITFLIFAVITFCVLITLNVVVQILFTLVGKNQGVLGDHEIQVRDDGLIETTPTSASSYNWAGFQKFRASPNFFFLYVSGNIVHYVPKRCFASVAAAAQFRELILAKARRT